MTSASVAIRECTQGWDRGITCEVPIHQPGMGTGRILSVRRKQQEESVKELLPTAAGPGDLTGHGENSIHDAAGAPAQGRQHTCLLAHTGLTMGATNSILVIQAWGD